MRIFIPVWMLVIALTYIFYREQQHDLHFEILEEQHTTCLMAKNVVEDDLKTLFNELHLLSADPSVAALLSQQGPEREATAQQIGRNYLRVMKTDDTFDQLRVIDMDGMEAVRVNYNNGSPSITPKSALQNKRGRYYFKDTVKLSAHEFYVSPFDLNIEHGAIELPIKPMIRIGTPVVNEAGKKVGIVVINFLGKTLIDKIVRYAETEHSHTELVNAAGYWLRSNDPKNDWAFMYPGREERTFPRRFPDAWKKFARTEGGQFTTADGVFTYETISPIRVSRAVSSNGSPAASGNSARRVAANDYYWFLITHIPQDRWTAIQWSRRGPLLFSFLLVTLGVLIGAVYVARAGIRRREAETALLDTNRRLEQHVQDRTAELRREVQIRREAQRETQNINRELRSIFQASGDGILVVDKEMRIIQANPAALEFLKLSEESILHRRCCDVLAEDACHTDVCPIVGIQNGANRIEREAVKVREDGTELAGLVTAVPHLGEDGMLQGYIFSIKDISRWKKIQAENRALEEQLRQSQKMEAVGTLAGGIAHDFNNILMAIFGNIDLAAEEMDRDHPSLRYLNDAIRAAVRAKSLVQQILSFSRKSDLERKPVRFATVIEESERFLKASLSAGIEIQVEVDRTMPPLTADPTGLHQVLLNLCTNAAHAMDGVGQLRIRCESVQVDEPASKRLSIKPGRYQKLSVTDSGKGMDPETSARIFEPFYTTKPQGEGTGLGLSVVHGIAKSHGGTVRVESRLGRGTTFEVYFEETQSESKTTIHVSERPIQGTGEVILYVDDEVQLTALGKTFFEKSGFRVVAFTSAAEALQYIETHAAELDLVLTDCTMPQISGMQLATRIRTIRPDLPIVMYSGFVTPAVEAEALRIGVAQVLRKPLSGVDLVQQVGNVLRKMRAETS